MDYSRDGSDEERFTTEQISALEDSPGGPKTILSYMSIGAAEDHRWYWQPRVPGVPVEDEMVDLVRSIATYARVTHDHPDFQVCVQIAEELSPHPDYVEAVSGIGTVDLFYDGNRRQPAEELRWSVKQLDRFKAAGRPVLVTDYVTRPARLDAFCGRLSRTGTYPTPRAATSTLSP
jgi:endo-alpha-1,4-polygalactosaminidase (GH114 family)